MDTLFDSLNGNNKTCSPCKPLKGGVSLTSDHEKFWLRAIDILTTAKFFCHRKKSFVRTPCIQNFIKTIKGFLFLRKTFLTKFSYFLPRAFQQDPLENFFSSLRSHGVRNVSPTVVHFVNSFKALLINNFTNAHSPAANCEQDNSLEALDDLRCLVTGESVAGIRNLETTSDEVDKDVRNEVLSTLSETTKIAKCTITYVAGFVARKSLKLTGNCRICRNILLFSDGSQINDDFVSARQYTNTCRLVRPGTYLNYIVTFMLGKIFHLLPRVCNRNGLSKFLVTLLSEENCLIPLKCTKHNLPNIVLQQLITCILYFWVKEINLILKGRSSKFIKLMAIKDKKSLDPVKLMAYEHHLRYSKFKK
jgi:hypothetical protein